MKPPLMQRPFLLSEYRGPYVNWFAHSMISKNSAGALQLEKWPVVITTMQPKERKC